MITIDELSAIKDRVAAEMSLRQNAKAPIGLYKYHVLICGGTGCTSGRSKIIYDEFNSQLDASGEKNLAKVIMTGCFGLCAKGPIVIVYPEGTFYAHVKPEDVTNIINSHLINGKPYEPLVYQDGDKISESLYSTKFYAKQHRVALKN